MAVEVVQERPAANSGRAHLPANPDHQLLATINLLGNAWDYLTDTSSPVFAMSGGSKKSKTFGDATALVVEGTDRLRTGELIHLDHFTLMVRSLYLHRLISRSGLSTDNSMTCDIPGRNERDRRCDRPSPRARLTFRS
jgi:hypothetical protein